MFKRNCIFKCESFCTCEPKPKRLKTLLSSWRWCGNTLLHQFVEKDSRSETYINAVLKSMSGIVPVNERNEDGYCALHLAVFNNNVIMVRRLLSILADIDVNRRCRYSEATALHLAAERGYLSIVEELLNKGATADMKNQEGNTALCVAAQFSRLCFVRELLNKGATIEIKKKQGDTEKCVVAAGFSYLSCFERELLNKGATIEIRNKQDNTALCAAANSNRLSIVRELLNKGATIDIKNKQGNTALCIAAASGDLDLIKLLISKGANVYEIGECGFPLHYATRSGNLEAVKFLVSIGADLNAIDSVGNTVLHDAAGTGNLAIVEFFVSYGVNVNAENKNGWTPLYYAAESGSLATVEFLVSNGADVNSKYGWTTLLCATKQGHLDIIKFLLDRGVQVNPQSGCGSLLCAANPYKLEIIEFLIGKGADVNAKNEDGYAPLHKAYYEDTVKCLVSNGADVNAKDKKNKTPLHHASKSGCLGTVDFLISIGADIHAKCNENKTPLHYAARRGHLEIVELLMRKGADANAKDKNNETPLHYATAYTLPVYDYDFNFSSCDLPQPLHRKLKKTVEFLVSKGADINAMNKNGKTLLHQAVLVEPTSFVKMLIEKGANVNARDKKGNTPLYDYLDHLEYCVKIINKGFYYPDFDEYLMMRMMKLLLESNADVNIRNELGETVLCRIMRSDDYDLIKLFIESATDLQNIKDKCGTTPLSYAVRFAVSSEGRYGYPPGYTFLYDVIRLFLAKGADVNVRNDDNTTCLPAIIRRGVPEIVKMVLEGGLDLNARYGNGDTILHLACDRDNYSDIIEILLRKGIDVNTKNDFDETALHAAINMKHLDYVHLLLESGASVHVVTIDGWTPLHFACDGEDIPDINSPEALIIKLLLERGADVNSKIEGGETPLDLAKENKRKLCIDVLQNVK